MGGGEGSEGMGFGGDVKKIKQLWRDDIMDRQALELLKEEGDAVAGKKGL